jgi:phenylacetate-CoA ligase
MAVARTLDVIRSRYFRLPPLLKSFIAPILMAVPISIRYGETYRSVGKHAVRSETDAQFVHHWQLSTLRQILQLASRKSRYFSSQIQARFGSPFDFRNFNLEDLSSLPILTKAVVSSDPEAFCLAEAGDYDVDFTSGSSGRPPMKLYLERARNVREIAFLHHIWSRIGYRLGDGRAILRDYAANIPLKGVTWRYDAPLRELWLSPFHLNETTMDRYLELLHVYQVKYLYGVPSAIHVLARHASARCWEPPRSLRGVISASETVFSHQRRIIRTAFRVPVLSYYGMSERVALAGELVNQPGSYEFEPLYGIVELVDNSGHAITEIGKRGRLVCTGLFNKAMSLVRYDTGDRATLVRIATPENCYRMQVRDIRSRWNQEFVIGRNNEKVSMVNLHEDIGIVSDYQYVQSCAGLATIRVVPCSGVTQAELENLLNRIQKPVQGVIDLQMECVSSIPSGRTGKRKFVDQQIPLASD